MKRLSLLVLLVASAASAQPADSAAASGSAASPARPAWLSVNVYSSAEVDGGDGGVQEGLLGVALEYRRAVGAGPLLVQGGFSTHGDLFSSTELVEGHLALGTGRSAGPVRLSASVGPSLAHVRRYGGTDPDFVDDETQVVPGLYAGTQAIVAVFPRFGIGVEAFGHLNARMPVVGAGLSLAFGRLPGALIPNPPPTPRRPGP